MINTKNQLCSFAQNSLFPDSQVLRKYKTLEVFEKMNEEFAELLGIMAGDGCLSTYSKKYMIYISGNKTDDLSYHEKTTKTLFKHLFDKNIKIDFRNKEHTLFIRFSDKNIFKKLAKYLPVGKKYDQLKIPNEVIKNKKYLFAFIRGIADTDGSMVFSKQHKNYAYYPRIEIASKSKYLLDILLSELKKNGFYGSVSKKGKNAHRLEIPGKINLKLWLQKIGFNNNKHIKKIKGHQMMA